MLVFSPHFAPGDTKAPISRYPAAGQPGPAALHVRSRSGKECSNCTSSICRVAATPHATQPCASRQRVVRNRPCTPGSILQRVRLVRPLADACRLGSKALRPPPLSSRPPLLQSVLQSGFLPSLPLGRLSRFGKPGRLCQTAPALANLRAPSAPKHKPSQSV